jgi:hypothetical protein
MPALVAGIHVLLSMPPRRGWPGRPGHDGEPSVRTSSYERHAMRVAASFDLRVARFECQTAETIADTRPRSGAAIARPELMSSSWPSRERGRREGRVPTAPMVRVQQKARGRTTGTGGSSGLPCAMVLRFIRALPGDHAWLPPSPARRVNVFATLAPASERQDHTTSPSATPSAKAARRAWYQPRRNFYEGGSVPFV